MASPLPPLSSFGRRTRSPLHRHCHRRRHCAAVFLSSASPEVQLRRGMKGGEPSSGGREAAPAELKATEDTAQPPAEGEGKEEERLPASSSAYRNFFDRYDGDAAQAAASASTTSAPSVSARMQALVSTLRREVVGGDAVLDCPFGPRPLLYADWTASGRALRCVERFVVDEVLPTYGNTHTSSSYSGLQTSLFRQEARDLMGRQCGCGKDDVVLFTGTGSSGAMALLIRTLARLWEEAGAQPSEVVALVGAPISTTQSYCPSGRWDGRCGRSMRTRRVEGSAWSTCARSCSCTRR